jgi:putative transposase
VPPEEFGTGAHATGFSASGDGTTVYTFDLCSWNGGYLSLTSGPSGVGHQIPEAVARPRVAAAAVCLCGASGARKGGKLLCAGGVRDHVHFYIEPPGTLAVAELVSTIKANTTRWIHQTFPHRRDFKWQHGYGAFTVTSFEDDYLRDYIRNQEIHHRERAYAGEYLGLLQSHGVAFDPAHVLD